MLTVLQVFFYIILIIILNFVWLILYACDLQCFEIHRTLICKKGAFSKSTLNNIGYVNFNILWNERFTIIVLMLKIHIDDDDDIMKGFDDEYIYIWMLRAWLIQKNESSISSIEKFIYGDTVNSQVVFVHLSTHTLNNFPILYW